MAEAKRGRGRPANPDAGVRESIRIRPSEIAALEAKHPNGWRARVAQLIAADITA